MISRALWRDGGREGGTDVLFGRCTVCVGSEITVCVRGGLQ
jgi:hypothetical protein